MLREARTKAGMSQWDVANRMGVPQTVISKAELGVRRLDAVELIAFSHAVGFDVVEFMSELRTRIGFHP